MPLVFCNEEGINLLIRRFGRFEASSLHFIEGGLLTALEALVWVSCPQVVPAVITMLFADNLFPVWVDVMSKPRCLEGAASTIGCCGGVLGFQQGGCLEVEYGPRVVATF